MGEAFMSRWFKILLMILCLLLSRAGLSIFTNQGYSWAADTEEEASSEEIYEEDDEEMLEENERIEEEEGGERNEPPQVVQPPKLVEKTEVMTPASAASVLTKAESTTQETKTTRNSDDNLMDEEAFLEEEAGISKEERITSDEKGKLPSQGYEVRTLESDEADYEGERERSNELAEISAVMEESEKIPSILTTLEECKRVALMNDRRIQVALKQVNYDRFKVQEAELAFLPQLKGTWERQEGDAANQKAGEADTAFNSMKYGLESEQIVFQGGKLVYTLKQAKSNLEIAKKKFYQARQEAIYKVEKAYYTLVKSQMVFEVQADLSKAAESALSFSREAYRQGLNSYHEFLNVQSQTDQTYYQLLSDQQEITMAELGLRQACNIDTSIGIQVDAVLTFTDFNFNYSLDECLELAFKNRPDLAVNELTALSDLYGVKLAMAETMPKVAFTGSVGKTGQNQKAQKFELTDEWSLKLEATWMLGANSGKYSYEKKKTAPKTIGQQDNTKSSATHNASLALFDKMENFSNVAKAQVQKATTEADMIEMRGKVANEVEENYFNYQKAMTMVTASLSKIKFREKDLEINRAKQMMDEIPLSQVLTSELELGQERTNYVKALSDYYIAISGLFKAMGLAK